MDSAILARHGESEFSVRGALNGGTQPLRVRTNDGSITLALSE